MKKLLAIALLLIATPAVSQQVTTVGPNAPCQSFGTTSGTCIQGAGAGGTPSSITLTNGTALPVAGITSSTSTALGVGSLELGNASDTTLARVSGGVMSVEGVRVITSAGTTSGTILKNNGTTFVASTETYAAPGTSGNVMTSDGTNWTSATPAASGVSSITGTANQITASAATGAVTLSITTNPTLPGITTSNSFVPTSSTIATNGLYLSASNVPSLSSNSRQVMDISSPASNSNYIAIYGSAGNPYIFIGNPAGSYASMGYNAKPKTSANAWTYGVSDIAIWGQYGTNNALTFFGAASGTAGNDITPTTIMTVGYQGLVAMPAIAADTGVNDRTLCWKTDGSGSVLSGTGTLGICLGTSSARFKTDIVDLDVGLNEIMALKPKSFFMADDKAEKKKLMYGFMAEDGIKVLPKLTGLDDKGEPNTFDYLGIVPVLVNAFQQMQREIDTLNSKVGIQ